MSGNVSLFYGRKRVIILEAEMSHYVRLFLGRKRVIVLKMETSRCFRGGNESLF